MPNIKSAKKRVRSNRRKALRNKMRKAEYRTLLKKATNHESILVAIRALDRAVSKGNVHKNKVARMKSRLGRIERQKD